MRTCQDIRDDLLAAASPAALAATDAAVGSHLNQCTACQSLLKQIQAMETCVKAVPTPASCETLQQRFLQQLPVTTPASPRRRRTAVYGWATAAAVFLAVGVAAYVLTPAATVQAKTQVVESLVEWNLKLSEMERPDDRGRLHENSRPRLQDAVRTATLSPRERQLADQLLEHADWLVRHDDTLEAAERFQDLAGLALEVLDESPQAEQYAVVYSQLMDRGVEPNLEEAEKTPSAADAKRQAKLTRLAKQRQQHQAKLKAMESKLTAATREKAQTRKKARHPK